MESWWAGGGTFVFPNTKLSFLRKKTGSCCLFEITQQLNPKCLLPSQPEEKCGCIYIVTLLYKRKRGGYTVVSDFQVESSVFHDYFKIVHTNTIDNQDCIRQ